MRYSRATFLLIATAAAMDPSDQGDFVRAKSSSGSVRSASISGSHSVATATSAMRSFMHASLGVRTGEDMDYAGPLGLVGISKALSAQEVKIESDITAEGNKWGSIRSEKRAGWLDIMPSREAIGCLEERLQQPQDYIQPRDPTVDLLESIQRLNPGEVYHLTKREVIPSGDVLMAEGEAIIQRELYACQQGWLVNRMDPLTASRDEPCFEAPAGECTVAHEDWPTGRLLKCLLLAQERGEKLSNIDRKLVKDLLQIEADIHRNGLLEGKLVDEVEGEEDEAHYWARNAEFKDYVMQTCEQITAVWVMRAVPWFKYLQASADPCFYLLGRKRLTPAQTLEGMIVFRDKITRHSRYPDERYFEYTRWLALHWGRALTRYFPEVFHALPLEGDFWMYFSAFLLRPSMDPRSNSDAISTTDLAPLWDFIFANGRPAVFALYIASVEHARASYDAYMLAANRLRSVRADDATWDMEMREVMRVPESVAKVPKYCEGETNWELGQIAVQLTMKPMKMWFGPWEVSRVADLAKSIMAGRFSVRNGFTPPRAPPTPKRRSGVFSDIFRTSGSAADARADAFTALNRPIDEADVDDIPPTRKPAVAGGGGRGLFSALKSGGLRVKDELVEKVRPVATEINFTTLVDLIDILVDDRMKDSGQILLDPHFGVEEEVMTRLNTDLGLSIDTRFPTSMDAVEKAIEIIRADAAPARRELAAVELAGVIDILDPFSVVVDGVKRDLPRMRYEEMRNSLLNLVHTCNDGIEGIAVDLHPRRYERVTVHQADIGRDKDDWFLTDLIRCLMDSRSTMGAIPRGFLEALIQIRTATMQMLVSDPVFSMGRKEMITRDCEEILGTFAIGFARSADSVSIYHHEMLKWCAELKSLLNAEGNALLSNSDVLNGISVISNKIIGISRFGATRAPEYVRTLAEYAVGAYLAVIPKPELWLYNPQRRSNLIKRLTSFILEPSIGDLRTFWELMLRENRAGFLALIFAEINSWVDISENTGTTAARLAYTTRILTEGVRPNVLGGQTIQFQTLVQAIDVLVEGAMKRSHI